ncbi:MAG TPA: type II secretion system F family protein [Candidatus Paceibacterota bacterium]
MSHFNYKARKATGEMYSGEQDAADRFELYKIIRESGDEIVSFKEKNTTHGVKKEVNIPFLNRVKTPEKINFARNLGLMLGSGLSLARALSVLERQSKNKELKKVIVGLSAEVTRGSTLADALMQHPRIFPPLFSSMVHAGEQSGTLAEALKSVANQMESSYTLERRVRGALMYPGIIMCVMIVIGALMFIFVVPTLTKVFADLKVPLPAMTKAIISLSEGVQHHGILGAIILVFLVTLASYWFKKPTGKRFVHGLVLKIPGISGMVQEVNSARTARTLSSLITSGVEVVESVNITAMVVQNVYFKDVLAKAGTAIKKGELMSAVFGANSKYYPIFFAEMLSVGEETGKIGEMLANVSAYYENDVEQKTRNMSSIIEPILMVVIGAAVGIFAVSMIQPIYSLVSTIH